MGRTIASSLPSPFFFFDPAAPVRSPGPGSIRRRLASLPPLAAVLLVAACASAPASRPTAPEPLPASAATPGSLSAGALAEADLAYLRTRALMVPVQGVRAEKVLDTFTDRRGTTRRHNALDIMAPRGTPVLAADDGRVYKLRHNSAGGTTIYAMDPESRFVYYYAHLDRYRDGLAEGAPLAKGEVIGYVGTTGNAPPNIPHLHFQVMRLTTERRYWDGVPVDPKPFLALDGALASSQQP